MNWQHVEPAPAILVRPPAAASLDEAHAAIELWEFYSGKILDVSQRLTVEVMMAETSTGRWAARTTGREMPRQNGKGDELEVVELWGLTQRGEAIGHTAHELKTVASAYERMDGLLGHRDLQRKVSKSLQGIGQQRIRMHSGAEILYATRTKGGLRGLDDISRLVIDEAQHAQREQLASSTPTLLANPNPQMNFVGTGAIAGITTWWWEIRKRALGDDPGDFGYVGHTAERVTLAPDGRVQQDEVDPTDQKLWFFANPALSAGRGEVEFFAEQLKTLGADLFAREHLGVWDPPDEFGAEHPIDLEVWKALANPDSVPVSHKTWALAVAPDRKWSAIGKAGRNSEGRLHVEWMHHRAGTGWIVDTVAAEFENTQTPIRVLVGGAEGAFIDPLRERGVKVDEVSGPESARATGQLIDAANNGALVHLGQPSLDKALRGADVHTSPEGAMKWRPTDVEITPLIAVTIAAGGVPVEQAVDVSTQVW